jgi:hypothetical protein
MTSIKREETKRNLNYLCSSTTHPTYSSCGETINDQNKGEALANPTDIPHIIFSKA